MEKRLNINRVDQKHPMHRNDTKKLNTTRSSVSYNQNITQNKQKTKQNTFTSVVNEFSQSN